MLAGGEGGGSTGGKGAVELLRTSTQDVADSNEVTAGDVLRASVRLAACLEAKRSMLMRRSQVGSFGAMAHQSQQLSAIAAFVVRRSMICKGLQGW